MPGRLTLHPLALHPLALRPLCLALLASVAIPALPAQAAEYGDFAYDTLRTLTIDHAGRHSGTEAFEDAADWMSSRFTLGGTTLTRQPFTTRRGLASQNVIGTVGNTDQGFILVGAHFDSAPQRPGYTGPALQGVDDNGSGAAVLTEIAAHLAGLPVETGLVFNAFGAEETGLEGSAFYRQELEAAGEIDRLKGMINIDSLITGDFMYAHAGTNYLTDRALKSYWTRIHAIADELGIDLRSNPGLNPHYPVDTGCCSDAGNYEDLNIPVLWLEATNWEIGDLDGYTQTTNPGIPGGASWHDPAIDNWDVLEAAFGPDHIPDRLEDWSRLLTRLLVELTNADLAASAQSGAGFSLAMTDQLARDHQAFQAAVDRAVLALFTRRPGLGETSVDVFVEGLARPGGFDGAATADHETAGRIGFRADHRLSDLVTLGADLHLSRGRDDLAGGSDLDRTGVAFGLGVLVNDGAPGWLAASVSAGYARVDGIRAFTMTSGLGATILDQRFDGQTNARSFGARIEGGWDLALGGIATGPVVGLDYTRYELDGFTETGPARTALTYPDQHYSSAEGELGWRVRGSVAIGEDTTLAPYARAGWVHEFADGRPDAIRLTAGDGSSRQVALAEADDDFGRATLGARIFFGETVSTYAEVETRFGHDDGAQTAVTAGLGLRF